MHGVRGWQRQVASVAAAAAMAALAVAGCGGGGGGGSSNASASSGSGGGSAKTVDITFGLFGAQSDAGVLIAKARGYFRRQGINIKFASSPTPDQTISLLAGGRLDMAGVSPSPGFFNAIVRGVNVKLLADKGQIGPGHSWVGVVVRKDLWDSGQVRTIKSLKGRKIGSTGIVSSTGAEFAKLLAQNGLSVKDVQLNQAANPADTLTALQHKAIDAAVLQEPFVALAQVTGAGHELAPLGPVLPNGQNGVIAVGAKLLGEPDVLSRFMKAYLKGVADYRAAFPAKGRQGTGAAAVTRILINGTQVKKPSLYKQIEPVQFSPTGAVDTASIDYFQRFFMQQKLQGKLIPASQYVAKVPAG